MLNKPRAFSEWGEYKCKSSVCFKEKSDLIFCTHLSISGMGTLKTCSLSEQLFQRPNTEENLICSCFSSVFLPAVFNNSHTWCVINLRDVTALISYGSKLRTLRGSWIPFQHLTLQLGSTGCHSSRLPACGCIYWILMETDLKLKAEKR